MITSRQLRRFLGLRAGLDNKFNQELYRGIFDCFDAPIGGGKGVNKMWTADAAVGIAIFYDLMSCAMKPATAAKIAAIYSQTDENVWHRLGDHCLVTIRAGYHRARLQESMT